MIPLPNFCTRTTRRVLSRGTENAVRDNRNEVPAERIVRKQQKLDQPSSHYCVKR